MVIRFGARGSPLSLAQSNWARAELGRALRLSAEGLDESLPLIAFTTTGDRVQDRALLEAGGKGLFTKELDEALLAGQIDAAIHSLKDLPSQLPEGLCLAALPVRAPAHDVLITRDGRPFADLPQGALIGSASLRRQAQARHLRPDLSFGLLRGNVGTRLKRIEDGAFEATFLAAAGLGRLGVVVPGARPLPVEDFLPAPGQGALAIVCRDTDISVRETLALINDPTTALCIAAERAFLARLDGSCRTAIAALARLEGEHLQLIGEWLSPDGQHRLRVSESLSSSGAADGARLLLAAAMGQTLADKVIAEKARLGLGDPD